MMTIRSVAVNSLWGNSAVRNCFLLAGWTTPNWPCRAHHERRRPSSVKSTVLPRHFSSNLATRNRLRPVADSATIHDRHGIGRREPYRFLFRPQPIANTVQQELADIFQAPEPLHRRLAIFRRPLPQELPVFQQQQENVGDLQQVVVGFRLFRVHAEHVPEVEAAVLLAVEPLVLNLPSCSSSLVGDVDYVVGVHGEFADPGKGRGLAGHGLATLDGVEGMSAVLVVLVREPVDPAILLVDGLSATL